MLHGRVSRGSVFIRAHKKHALDKVTDSAENFDPVELDLPPAKQTSGADKSDHPAKCRETDAVPCHAFGEDTAQAPQECR